MCWLILYYQQEKQETSEKSKSKSAATANLRRRRALFRKPLSYLEPLKFTAWKNQTPKPLDLISTFFFDFAILRFGQIRPPPSRLHAFTPHTGW